MKIVRATEAGSAAWDIDVAVVHQRRGDLVNEKLLMPYRNDVAGSWSRATPRKRIVPTSTAMCSPNAQSDRVCVTGLVSTTAEGFAR
jgi:hypothetical protein